MASDNPSEIIGLSGVNLSELDAAGSTVAASGRVRAAELNTIKGRLVVEPFYNVHNHHHYYVQHHFAVFISMFRFRALL